MEWNRTGIQDISESGWFSTKIQIWIWKRTGMDIRNNLKCTDHNKIPDLELEKKRYGILGFFL